MIKDLEKRKDKAMIRSDTDDLWTKIETLQWVLFVIFAIRNGRMVMMTAVAKSSSILPSLS
jgi:DNA replication initiation complex subunit (GINS family)